MKYPTDNGNAETWDRELLWLQSNLTQRFKEQFSPSELPEPPLLLAPPAILPEDPSPIAAYIRKHSLGTEDRLLLASAISPLLKPELLDLLFTTNTAIGRGFTVFGGIPQAAPLPFQPTLQTAVWLVGGPSFVRRMQAQEWITGHWFFREQVLQLQPMQGQVVQSLTVCKEWLARTGMGQADEIGFSTEFPAERVSTAMERQDIVLSPATWDSVDEILEWLEYKERFEALPGMAKRNRPGFRALFFGPPGTGKTMVASWLGKVTGKPVYRVDLSMMVSKYIGETEKNLANVFRYASEKDWILFFDEADALFGKRTQVGNSNDRHANQEVSYLLQRVETYPGLVVLASNFKDNLDEAFIRRFDLMAHFTMPSPHQRMALWASSFSPALPLAQDVELFGLAKKHELSGGHITNVVRYATMKALRLGLPHVGEDLVVEGIKREMMKMGIHRV